MSEQQLHEKFNPNEFTEKELVKLIYRDLIKLQSDFEEFIKKNSVQKELSEIDKRLVALESELRIEKALRETTEKRNKQFMAWLAIGFSALQVGLKFLFKT